MTTRNCILHLNGVTFAYPGNPSIFNDLEFSFHEGERVGLVAPNGSGKTTLFHLLMGLLKPNTGQIEVFGKPVIEEKDFLEIRRRIGFLFQDADDQLFSPTVLEDVAFGPLNLGKTKQEAIDISRQTLDFLGLTGFEDRITFKLSGGEKRLVALATVLAMEPEVLFLDEPSAGLDDSTKDRLVAILKEIKPSYIIVSHEFDFLTELTESIYTLRDGKIILDTEAYLHAHSHAHQYGTEPHKHG